MIITENIVGILCGLVIIGEFICLGIALRIGYTKMDLMLAHFKNSPLIISLVPLRHGGIWGTLLLVGGISGVVTFPNLSLKLGTVDKSDIDSFPLPLRKKLVLLQWTVITLIGCMTFFAILFKSGILKHF